MFLSAFRRPARFAPLLVVAVLTYLLVGPVNLALRTALLIPQVFPTAPVRPLSYFTPQPLVKTIEIEWPGGSALADLYRPNDNRVHGALIIFLGVAQAPRDDPRIVRLGEGFARIGVVTLMPESPSLAAGRISEEAIEEIIAAFEYLSELAYVDPDRIGIVGFCIGASLAMIAAQDERIRDRIAFINDFDGYLNLEEYVVSIATRSLEPEPQLPGGERQLWEPAPNVRQILADHLVATLATEGDRKLVLQLLDAGPANEDQLSRLTPNARTILRIMWAQDAEEARRHLADLPSESRELLRRLSPDANLQQLKTKIFIMHDLNDTTVPYVESRRLARALTELGRPPVHTEFDLFKHVDPVQPLEPIQMVVEISRLYWHMYQTLAVVA